jgi:mannosylglucosylglycerate synthase
MRLAILHYSLPPVIGGVERVIRDQARALIKLGHEVVLFDSAAKFRESLANAPQAVLVHNVMTMPFRLEWTRELHHLAAEHPEILWVNWVHDVAAVNPAYAHLGWQEPLPEMLHVAVSETRRADYARATGLPLESIHVIPNGIDLACILGLTPRIAALPLGDRALVLMHPTRLVRRKNIELGLHVLAALRLQGCDAAYIVTGAPDPHQTDGVAYHQELKNLASSLDLAEHVLFLGETGPLGEDDVRSLYAVADALFFPSTAEGFGLPLLEALAHRLPIFCSNLPVHEEIIGRSLGHYFQTDAEPEAISAQIMRWLNENQPTRHRRLLRQKFDMLKICQEHLEPLLVTANESLST